MTLQTRQHADVCQELGNGAIADVVAAVAAVAASDASAAASATVCVGVTTCLAVAATHSHAIRCCFPFLISSLFCICVAQAGDASMRLCYICL